MNGALATGVGDGDGGGGEGAGSRAVVVEGGRLAETSVLKFCDVHRLAGSIDMTMESWQANPSPAPHSSLLGKRRHSTP